MLGKVISSRHFICFFSRPFLLPVFAAQGRKQKADSSFLIFCCFSFGPGPLSLLSTQPGHERASSAALCAIRVRWPKFARVDPVSVPSGASASATVASRSKVLSLDVGICHASLLSSPPESGCPGPTWPHQEGPGKGPAPALRAAKPPARVRRSRKYGFVQIWGTIENMHVLRPGGAGHPFFGGKMCPQT